MKLLTRTSLYLSSLSVLVFFLIGITFYSILKQLSNDELDTILLQEKQEVLQNPELLLIADRANAPLLSRVLAKEVEEVKSSENLFFDSTSMLKGYEHMVPIRCLKFYEMVQGQAIEFTLFKSRLPSETLVKQVTRTVLSLVILFLLGVFLTNQLIFRRVWADFFITIRALRTYVPDRKALQLPRSKISEFETLNREIEKMTGRVSDMYDNMQNFTSHTTHEFQTPLAVIRTKSELLLQNEALSCDQLELIQSISESARQLSQLNRSLSLLFKIDNRHFPVGGTCQPEALVKKQLEMLEEWIHMKQLQIKTTFSPGVTMPLDSSLAEILIHNLAKNAVVHNVISGFWEVQVDTGRFTIRNSGAEPDHPTERCFSEFVKGSGSKGLGLGLAMVKKICEVANLKVSYTYQAGIHQFEIIW